MAAASRLHAAGEIDVDRPLRAGFADAGAGDLGREVHHPLRGGGRAPAGLLVARHRGQHHHSLPRVKQRGGVQDDVLVDTDIHAGKGFADECRVRHRLEEVAAGCVEQPELPLLLLGQERVL